MEHLILKVLSFDLSTPTSLAFLSHYCISNGLSKKTFHLAAVSLYSVTIVFEIPLVLVNSNIFVVFSFVCFIFDLFRLYGCYRP